MAKPYQVCTRCVMDTTATEITFDEHGVCNFCTEFLQKSGYILHMVPEERDQKLQDLVAAVKSQGSGKPYDCVIGVSGGVDSSWALVQAVNQGLRPLAVHMDNGWNTELAQNNISNLVRGLGVDLHTHVIDWDEYRGLMQAFFDADVIDIELLYDNAMLAVNYQQAAKYGLKHILSGSNSATEGMRTPREWNWFKRDKRNIKALAKRFGKIKLNTFPSMSTFDFIWFEFVRNIRWINFLDYLPYNKFHVLDVLQKDFGYKPYPYKHYESVFTRFYQGYLLPRKFKVDKRRLHLSALVISDQMSRGDALGVLEGIPYPSHEEQDDDVRYFLKKMGWTRAELDDYLVRPEIKHTAYPTEKPLWDRAKWIYLNLFK